MFTLMEKQPIGVFDSGVGGTSILNEIVKLLPNEDYLYLADSKNAPYGQKSVQEIKDLCHKNVEWLLAHGAKIIVVACNTATTNAIDELRQTYNVPFIGIEPAIKPAALNTQTNTIGILATKGTLNSTLFCEKVDLYSSKIKIIEVVGKGLVEAIESGDLSSDALKLKLEGFVKPMLAQKIDYLVLGCSHYPYLIPLLKSIVPSGVKIIDSGEAVAKQTKSVLQNKQLLNAQGRSDLKLYSNSNLNALNQICERTFKDFDVQFLDF